MRHKKSTKKFKRTTEERRKLKVDLTTALIKHKQIMTFTARAKWFAPFFERLVTLCKRSKSTQEAYRKVRVWLDEPTARILVEDIAPKMNE